MLSNNARTLEDLVKEMLRPMLKSWLDDNLPGLVERIVKAEIERVSRGGPGRYRPDSTSRQVKLALRAPVVTGPHSAPRSGLIPHLAVGPVMLTWRALAAFSQFLQPFIIPRDAMIEKNYQPADIESRMSRIWEESGAFRAGRPERKDAAPFTIVIPPPNVTGSLHMGHALNNTLQDILCRFERMRGRDVLWQPGTDHAGIATQMVVERQLMERQEPGRRDMGRAKFLERVWQWKAESGGTIVNQLKRLGASCDWSRERFTMDEGLSRAVVKVFVELHRARPDLQGQAAGATGIRNC